MSTELIALVLFSSLIVFLMLGVPIAFVMGGVGVLVSLFIIGPQFLDMVPFKIFAYMTSFVIIAAPLFIFMALILERCGITDDLYTMLQHWVGFLPGGLAIGTVIVCTIFAAMSGISAGATVAMGIIALPAMLKRGYDKKLAGGSIIAGGGLGQLIPPSIFMIVVAMLTGESVGRLFMGGIFPGLLLSFLFIAYIVIRCTLRPSLAPPLPPEERLPWRRKIVYLRGVILPLVLVAVVLGSIFAGIASPTEAAALGCLGSIVMGVARRRLSWQKFKEATYQTFKLMGFCMWIIFGAAVFISFAMAVGLQKLIFGLAMTMPGGRWGAMIAMQGVFFILGCFMDNWAIIMLTIPLFTPIVKSLGFDMIWFLVLFIMNMLIGFITPPFGYNLFYLKGVITEDMGITMGDIYRSALPFVILQVIGLIIVMIFPAIALWLPNRMIMKGG